jgi:ABC-2 type transport system ATP-binding protein
VGIDPQSRRKILDLVKSLNSKGLSVLYTTHYMEEAEELCHRIGIIDHGEIIAEGSIPDLRAIAGQFAPIRITLRGTPTDTELKALEGLVERVSFEDDELTLLTPEPKTVLPQILALLAGTSLEVHHLEIDEPNLEAVFLKLTGRRLRD